MKTTEIYVDSPFCSPSHHSHAGCPVLVRVANVFALRPPRGVCLQCKEELDGE